MDILERYETALKFYKTKNFDVALEIVKEIQIVAPHWNKNFLLEIFIRREQGEVLKEFSLLEKFLPRLDLNSADEKDLAADAFNCSGSVNRFLGRTADSVRAFCLSASLSDDNKKACEEISNALFAASSSENFSAEDFQNLYAEYKKYLADVVSYQKIFYSHEKVRVGFLSGSFQWHVVMAWSWHLLSDLDEKSFEVYCYSNVETPDEVTNYFHSIIKNWRDIFNLTDEQAAKIIRDDEIDILFDLDGHTINNRLRVAAYRPASVQMSGIGYMNSTGLECFDYFLSDKTCAGDENFFTEKVIKLEHSHICYEPPTKLEPAKNPPCLKNNFVTFGSFNQYGKITDSILIAWKKILDAVPASRLILKHKIFNTSDGKNFVGEQLKSFGFDLAQIDMRPYSANHLVEYADVDIALDTFPYTGGITTCEALFMGVPVVSLYGKRHGTRFGLSILKNIGLEELAVDSYDEYINRAVMLAGDWELLTILRKNLRPMMKKSPLMDSTNYLREIQAAFIKILNEQKKNLGGVQAMDVDELYLQAEEMHKAKNYDAEFKILDEIKKIDPTYKRAYYMEAWALENLGNYVKEYYALEKILPLLDFSSSEERFFASEVLCHIGDACIHLGLSAEAKEFYSLMIKIGNPPKIECLDCAIFHSNSFENSSSDYFRALYDEYKKTLADIVPYPKKFYNHKKIRVGFLSADFNGHVAIIQTQALLTRLDKNLFKTYFYSNNKINDDITKKLRLTADGWCDIYNLTDEQAAKLIRDDEIDILFDLSGHTKGNRLRLAAYRPASVQMSGIGYMNSTGLECFDYFLSDETCAGDETFFTEKIIKLPHSHFCHEPSIKFEPAKNPPCLKNNFVTFGSFNKFDKMTDSMLRAWKKILDAVPKSRLLLKAKIFNMEDGKNFVRDRLKNFDFDLAQVEMRPTSSTWLAEYGDVDIALDTFPYTGGITTCEALFMGVPVVSLYGKRHGSRFGLSILKNIGLEELAVDSYDEYINRAVMLAGDWELLTILRKNLRTMMKKSPLMDSANYLREIQTAFVKILAEQKNLWRNTDNGYL